MKTGRIDLSRYKMELTCLAGVALSTVLLTGALFREQGRPESPAPRNAAVFMADHIERMLAER